MVEEAFAPLVRLHDAVSDVVPVASRRWRKAPLNAATWREFAVFRQAMRDQPHETVIDAQGLLRSGLVTWLAGGRKHGYDRESVRERFAARLYDVRHGVPRGKHAIVRNLALTALALVGLLPPSLRVTSGSAWFTARDGVTRDLLALSESQLRTLRGDEIGLVFQDPGQSLNPVHRVGDQGAAGLLLEHVDGEGDRLGTKRLELLHRVGVLRRVPPGNHDGGPGPGQAFRHAEADAAVSAGDHGDLAREIEKPAVHVRSSVLTSV